MVNVLSIFIPPYKECEITSLLENFVKIFKKKRNMEVMKIWTRHRFQVSHVFFQSGFEQGPVAPPAQYSHSLLKIHISGEWNAFI